MFNTKSDGLSTSGFYVFMSVWVTVLFLPDIIRAIRSQRCSYCGQPCPCTEDDRD